MKKLIFVTLFSVISASLYAQGNWERLTDFAGARRCAGASFSLDTDGDGVNDMGFITCGFDLQGTDFNDTWAYDPATDTWTQKASFPGLPRRQVAYFVIDNKAYVGAGAYTFTSQTYFKDFYRYDPITDSWSAVDNLPGNERWASYGFSVNGKGYVTMGTSNNASGNGNYTDVYELDPNTGSWTQKNDFPAAGRRGGAAFSVDTDSDGVPDRAYIIDGRVSGSSSGYRDELWEYLPATDTWVQRSSKGTFGLGTPSFAVMGETVYVGMGSTPSGTDNEKFWTYDVNADNWALATLFPDSVSHGAECFEIGNDFYITCGSWEDIYGLNYHYRYSLDTCIIHDTIIVTDTITIRDTITIVDSVTISDTITVRDTIFITDTITVYDTTGILSPVYEELSVSIYPNPNSGDFNLVIDDKMQGTVSIEVLSVAGKEVVSEEYNLGNDHTIRLHYNYLEKGVYLMRVRSEEYFGVARFIVTE